MNDKRVSEQAQAQDTEWHRVHCGLQPRKPVWVASGVVCSHVVERINPGRALQFAATAQRTATLPRRVAADIRAEPQWNLARGESVITWQS